jgi:membrane-associated phospholipid phosphatase
MYFISSYQKNDIHLYINSFVGNKFINAFFYYVTFLGDGRFAVLLLLIIVLVNIRTGIYTAFSFLTSALVSNGLKYFFFDDVNRPHFIFKWVDKHPLNLVEGVDLHIHNSFPSGHATQGFAILMCLAFISQNRYLKVLFFGLAVITALSRVYLSQHWLVDITAGSLIGLACSLFYYYLIIHRNRFRKLNKPLSALKRS